jgi:hypothetical protein
LNIIRPLVARNNPSKGGLPMRNLHGALARPNGVSVFFWSGAAALSVLLDGRQASDPLVEYAKADLQKRFSQVTGRLPK